MSGIFFNLLCMKSIFAFVILFYCNLFQAQLEFENLEIDFGQIKSLEDRIIDISVKNKAVKRAYFLSFRGDALKTKELVLLTKGEFVEPDSTSFLRVQVNPKKIGVFKYKVEFYTSDSDQPRLLTVKGDLKIQPENTSTYQACPSFNQRPIRRKQNHTFSVKLLDAQTSKAINGKILLIQNGLDFYQLQLKNGTWNGNLSEGFTYALVKQMGYQTLDTSFYLSKNQKELVLKLIPINERISKEIPQEIKVDTVIEQPKQPMIPKEELVQKKTVQLDELPLSNFDSAYFKPINVVFVLDISSSMASYGKIDLLKYSLYQLLAVLREQDKIGLVTYSNEASVLLKPTSGIEKEIILEEIKNLHTSGLTAGMDGIKLGFKQVEKSRINLGVNQVILITDGAFNKNNGDYLGLIEKYAAKGILFSVVGIKNSDRDILNMQEAALRGKGVYIPINKTEEAEKNIIQELRRQTFKENQ